MDLPALDWVLEKIKAISKFFAFPFLACIVPFCQSFLWSCQWILIIFQPCFPFANHYIFFATFLILSLISCSQVFDTKVIVYLYQSNSEHNSCIEDLFGKELDFSKNNSSHLQNNWIDYLWFLIIIKYYWLMSRAIEIPRYYYLACLFPSCVLRT